MSFKKVITALALCALSGSALAQTGQIEFKNTTACTAYVNVIAQDPYDLYPGCSLISNEITLAPGAVITYTSVFTFQSAIGWAPPAPTYTAVSAGSLTFKWDFATFQFDCSGAPCPDDGGGGVGNADAICTSLSSTWTTGVCNGAEFMPTAGAGTMGDVVIWIY
jgi:hypothetical protein